MAYDSRLTGSLRIEPPLTWPQFKDSALRRPDRPQAPAFLHASLVLREHVDTTDTATGRVQDITATGVEPATSEALSHYTLDDELAALAAAYGADHTFHGWIVRTGDDQGDVQRYTIRDGHVVTETATLTWPDGSTVA